MSDATRRQFGDTEARDDYLAAQIARHDEELDTMRKMMCAQVSDAIEQGIMRAVSNPQLWAQAGMAIQAQAKQRAGGWLLGGIAAIFSRVGWVIMAIIAVYSLGGFPALIAMLKAWAAGGAQT
jgi:hypothetical protein